MNTAQQVITYIRQHGPSSRAELARQVRRSKPATSAAIDQLLQLGVLAELGQGRPSVGRPPTLVNMNRRFRLVAGAEVDVGDVRVGIGDLHGDLIEQRSYAWDTGTLGVTLARALDELGAAHGAGPVHALAVGLPGVVRGPVVSHAPNLPELEDAATLDDLRRALPLPTSLHNDVNLAAVSEARPGESLAFVSIGSGFGVGITQGRELLTGHQGRAGELGYLPDARGQNLEGVLSEAGLAALLGLTPDQLRPLLAGRDPAILGRAAARPFVDGLLTVLQILTLTLDPARIVIGGRIGRRLFTQLPALQEELRRTLPFAPELSIAQDPGGAVVQGAVQMAAARATTDLLDELSRRTPPDALA
ncbi:ROK family protein [Deinococcus sp. KSM4-11]|uniref:ROK family protein n=1 Tax=Deinococcus sp. KSM4-11 TaxID=2568654 RepID=UPI0010A3F029|nr:ROK family protein [Deinococcus sp. KSM4-11]THF85532.1 ROK family protein [Deinococcus sp. KSM4-11]